MRCLVELHFPNFFGQCLNARIFVKRRFLLYLIYILFFVLFPFHLKTSTVQNFKPAPTSRCQSTMATADADWARPMGVTMLSSSSEILDTLENC